MPATLGTTVKDLLVTPLGDARTRVAAVLGNRVWKVYLDLWTWSGTRRGVGSIARTSHTAITMDGSITGGYPEVEDHERREYQPGGVDAGGRVVLRKVSRKYTEAELWPTPAANAIYHYTLEDARGASGQYQPTRWFILGDGKPLTQDLEADNAWVVVLRETTAPA